jgi:peptidoglycan/LPS O-acetylase OafA/YrhL
VFFAIRYFDTHWSYVVRIVVAFTVTLALTLTSWFLLERPLMRWRKRLEAKRIAEPVVPSDPTTSSVAPPSDNGPVAGQEGDQSELPSLPATARAKKST